MADRRPEEQEMSRAKRHKTDDLDPKSNPYLAHMYESEESYNGLRSSNGFGSFEKTSLSGFKRHATTAAQAHTAEDGPLNPFNNNSLSNQYFNILKTRRDLPVHKQR
jgi:pre-mRNA-splicing factor ATP-dependent RNA helicase DHX15/PRP43